MGFEKNTNRGSWEVGVSNYWGNILFQRCLKSDAFREKLDQVIEELRKGIRFGSEPSTRGKAWQQGRPQ